MDSSYLDHFQAVFSFKNHTFSQKGAVVYISSLLVKYLSQFTFWTVCTYDLLNKGTIMEKSDHLFVASSSINAVQNTRPPDSAPAGKLGRCKNNEKQIIFSFFCNALS